MKLAIPYTTKQQFQDIADEYNIRVRNHNDSYLNAITFLGKMDKRINIEFEDFDIEKICNLFKMNNNIVVRIMPQQINDINILKENNIPFLLDVSIPIYSYAMLDWAVKLSPTDIYITDDLCYDLANVKNICAENNISLRFIGNRAQTALPFLSSFHKIACFKPQQFEELNLYFSTIEFDCFQSDNTYDYGQLEILYKYWFKLHKWDKELMFINKDINFNFQCKYFFNDTSYNFNCRYRCYSFNTKACNRCELLQSRLKLLDNHFGADNND